MHPTSIYEAILYTAVFLILWSMRRRAGVEGRIFCLYLVLLGACRFMVEFLRINPRVLFGLSEAQLIALAMVVTGLVALYLTGGVFSGWTREERAPQSRPRAQSGGGGVARRGRFEDRMAPRVKLLSTIAGAALLASVLLIAASQIRRATPPAPQPREDTASSPGQMDRVSMGTGRVAAGEKAAPFKLTDLQGDSVSMADLHGKVVFLNIWATWCAPCREEMPSMEKLYQRLRDNKGFVMLAVSQDTSSRDEVVAYVKKHGYHFDVLLDPKNAVAEAYKVSGVPETFIIDREGRIVAHHSGAFDWSQPGFATRWRNCSRTTRVERIRRTRRRRYPMVPLKDTIRREGCGVRRAQRIC